MRAARSQYWASEKQLILVTVMTPRWLDESSSVTKWNAKRFTVLRWRNARRGILMNANWWIERNVKSPAISLTNQQNRNQLTRRAFRHREQVCRQIDAETRFQNSRKAVFTQCDAGLFWMSMTRVRLPQCGASSALQLVPLNASSRLFIHEKIFSFLFNSSSLQAVHGLGIISVIRLKRSWLSS